MVGTQNTVNGGAIPIVIYNFYNKKRFLSRGKSIFKKFLLFRTLFRVVLENSWFVTGTKSLRTKTSKGQNV